ncbi:MAG TPA: TetR/AcrR family transcriptional regulator [Ktedonobacteraceae bacterium]|nr:TetR/AcrR family transcriptional regulator [Ktedonobacteraceae bacterium]
MSTDTPQSSIREKLRQKRSELILETAEDILTRKGYHNSSMDEIAAQAGVAKGTLYQHFPTKEDLFFALIEQALTRFEHLVQQVTNSSSNAHQKLERIFSYIYGEKPGTHIQLLRLLQNNEELSLRLQEKRIQSGERIHEAIDQIRSILEDGKTQGLFDASIETELMLHLFLHLLSFSGQEQLFGPIKATPEELIAQLERLFFQGIQSSQSGLV